jgi:hypothetical protein
MVGPEQEAGSAVGRLAVDRFLPCRRWRVSALTTTQLSDPTRASAAADGQMPAAGAAALAPFGFRARAAFGSATCAGEGASSVSCESCGSRAESSARVERLRDLGRRCRFTCWHAQVDAPTPKRALPLAHYGKTMRSPVSFGIGLMKRSASL